MIKTALVAMTIVGCDCDAKLCEYIGETPAKWSTVADCEAAMKNQMLQHRKGFSYPVVSGICRTVQPQTAMTVSAALPKVASAPLDDEIAALGLHRPENPVGPRPQRQSKSGRRPANPMSTAVTQPSIGQRVVTRWSGPGWTGPSRTPP